MASPLVGRPPTCLACLRRITSSHNTGSASVALTQVRGKKTEGRLRDQGVVIRLLKDIPQYGPEGSIIRTPRERMRNHLFPRGKAEYVTREQFSELGLAKEKVGGRDYQFGLKRKEEDIPSDVIEAVAGADYASANPSPPAFQRPTAPEPQPEVQKPAVEVGQLSPNRAHELMQAMIPEIIVFERRLVHIPAGGMNARPEPPPPPPEPAKPEPEVEVKPAAEPEQPKKALSPLEARRAMLKVDPKQAAREAAEKEKARLAAIEREKAEKLAAEEAEKERKQREKEYEESLKIHGSVTLRDIAGFLQEKMLLDPEASRIHVQPQDIKFIGLEEGVDKIEKIGSFEIEIRTHVGKASVEPARRKLEVVPH